MSNITDRIERELELPSLLEKLAHSLSASDFSALLIEACALRSGDIIPAELLKQYASNRYSAPAKWNAAKYRRLESKMLDFAESCGIECLLLSPLSTFGSCSAFGAVHQSKIISAVRGTEVLSDATNMLALYLAEGLKTRRLDNKSGMLSCCTTHRHVRYQAQFKENRFPHFGLFTMVSSGQSQSSYGFEIAALTKHIRFYTDYWRQSYDLPFTVKLNKRGGYKDIDGFFSQVSEALTKGLPDISIEIDPTENGTGYYKGLRVTMNIPLNGELSEIGDMGFTDWTQKLLGRPGERLLISSLALDVQMLLDGSNA